jgi:hypothetical protein
MALEGLLFSIPEDREPYQELVNAALRTGPDHQRTLVRLAAILLARWIEGQWNPALPGRAQFNLLHLCANLEGQEELAALVWHVYEQRDTLITGDYPQANLPSALLAAMIRNQPYDPSLDSPFRSFWLDLLEERFPGGMSATLADGFYGFVRMPHWATADLRQTENELAKAAAILRLRAEDIDRLDLYDRWIEFIPKTIPGLNLRRIIDLAENFAVVRRFARTMAPIAAAASVPGSIPSVCRRVEAHLLSPSSRTSCNEAAVLNLLRLESRSVFSFDYPDIYDLVCRATTAKNAAHASLVRQEELHYATV